MGKKNTTASGKSIIVVIPADNKNKRLCLVGRHRNGLLNFPFRHVNKRMATLRTANEVLKQYLTKTVISEVEHTTELAISFTYKVNKSIHRVFVFVAFFKDQTALQDGMYVEPEALRTERISPLCSKVIQELHNKAT